MISDPLSAKNQKKFVLPAIQGGIIGACALGLFFGFTEHRWYMLPGLVLAACVGGFFGGRVLGSFVERLEKNRSSR
jgi:membrane associated rhomboid family serine protease